jgi:hypothetical protein
VEPSTEAPPVADAPALDLSLEQIIATEVAAATAEGAEVVQADKPADETATTTEAAPAVEAPATEEAPAVEPPADDVTAARVRKMLAEVQTRTAALDAREQAISQTFLADFLKSPKATLAKFGRSIDDVIDASLSEGNEAPAAAESAPRETDLEKRVAAMEAADLRRQEAEKDRAISTRKTEIHGEIAKSAKFPVINETKRHGLVTDFMVEYHSLHGKAISWDKAADLVEKDLTGVGIATAKKLGWAAPAPKPAAAAVERPGTVSIGGSARDAAPTSAAEPDDPNQLMRFLAAQHGLT